jgi:hypothetical protein
LTNVTIEPSSVEVEVTTQRDLVVPSARDIDVEAQTSTITGVKKEYSIVGDGIYASVSADEAPSWLLGLIDNAVATSVSSGMVNYDLLVQDVLNAIGNLEVAENAFNEQVDITTTADGVLGSRIDTLNATVDSDRATVVNLDSVVVNNAAASALSISNVSANLGTTNSNVANLQTALTTSDTSSAADILALTTSIEDQNGVTATSISDLEISSQLYTDLTGTSIRNVYAYNSEIEIGGNFYKTGFGLNTAVTTGGTGAVGDGYLSEFWIDAEKFKFTNSNQTGSTSPFAIDASGPDPEIVFNGKVSFSNTTGTPTNTTGAAAPTGTAIDGSTHIQTSTTPNTVWLYNGGWKATSNPDALVAADLGPSGTTVINGGRIDTDTISAISADLGTITAGSMVSSDGKFEIDLNNKFIRITV